MTHDSSWSILKVERYAISKYQEGICLNPREYVLDSPDGNVMLFETHGQAASHLRKHWEDMPENLDDLDEYGIFIEPYKEQSNEQ